MVDQTARYFNRVYDRTYNKISAYVIAKCSNIEDISDILQEIYLEFYRIILKKGCSYVKNEEALLMKLARAKVYKHYSLLEKMKLHLPRPVREAKRDEGDVQDIHHGHVDESSFNNLVIQEVWEVLKGKPEQIQKIFYLYYYCDLKLREISAVLNLGESNVKHKLYRTLQEIRKAYAKEGC